MAGRQQNVPRHPGREKMPPGRQGLQVIGPHVWSNPGRPDLSCTRCKVPFNDRDRGPLCPGPTAARPRGF